MGLGGANGSIVEGLRVFQCFILGISANGIVKGNTVVGCDDGANAGTGIFAMGIAIGNSASGNRVAGIMIGQGSTVIGNTSTENDNEGLDVFCPSNVTDNTAVNNVGPNLLLNGNGCNNTNNVAP